MKSLTHFSKLTSSFFFIALLTACAPEVGSEQWCTAMNEKPKGDWTANEVGDYAKHCLLK